MILTYIRHANSFTFSNDTGQTYSLQKGKICQTVYDIIILPGLRALFSPNRLNHFHIIFFDVLLRQIEAASIIDLSFLRLTRAKKNTTNLGHPSCKYSSSCHKLDPETESRWTRTNSSLLLEGAYILWTASSSILFRYGGWH